MKKNPQHFKISSTLLCKMRTGASIGIVFACMMRKDIIMLGPFKRNNWKKISKTGDKHIGFVSKMYF